MCFASAAARLLHSCALASLFVLLSSVLVPQLCRAQDSAGAARPQHVYAEPEEVTPGEVVRTDTDLVPVKVTVRDGAGQVVRGLHKSDFRLFEDGVERPISFFNTETKVGVAWCPVDLVFALDVSGSMTRSEMEMLHAAAASFAERLSGPWSRFAVLSFGMRVKVLQSFTGDRQKLDRAFDSATRDEMGQSTHAYDAVDEAVRLLMRRGRKTSGEQVIKRVVIVISDGFPAGDMVSPRIVIERANAADVTVYTVTMPSYSFGYAAAYGRPLPTILDLSGLAAETGGTNVYATDSDYVGAFKAISKEVLSQYVLAFYPEEGKRRDSAFHKLRVVVPAGLTASQSRQGYAGNGSR